MTPNAMQQDGATIQALFRDAESQLQRRNFAAAKASLLKLTSLAPSLSRPWAMLAFVHVATKDYSRALEFYFRSYLIDPLNVPVIVSMARLQKMLGYPEAALCTLETALRLAPDDKEALQHYGDGKSEAEEFEAAGRAFMKILERFPDDLGALYSLAYVHEMMGETREAAELYGRIISSQRTKADKAAALGAACKISALAHQDIVSTNEVEKLLDIAFETARKTKVLFARATILVRAGKAKQAWEQLTIANRAVHSEIAERNRKASEQRAEVLSQVRDLAASVSSRPALSTPRAGPRPLFILGPSRSGKSLVERMLSSDGSVCRGFEAQIVETCLKRLGQEVNIATPLNALALPEAYQQLFSAIFHAEMGRLGGNRSVVTNTNPGNVEYLSLLAQSSDQARFVFVRRNRDDQLFRIFENLYGVGNSYAYDVRDIDDYLSWYEALVALWTKLFPTRCLVVSYEDLVTEPDRELGRIAAFSELKPGQLAFPIRSDAGCSGPYRQWIADALAQRRGTAPD